jgi:hypothetical protein
VTVELAIVQYIAQHGTDTFRVTIPDSVQHLRFPLSVSDPRNELDKKGTPCTVYDAVFNTDVVKQAMVTRRLKVFLVELVLQWIGQKYKSELDAQVRAFPIEHVLPLRLPMRD